MTSEIALLASEFPGSYGLVFGRLGVSDLVEVEFMGEGRSFPLASLSKLFTAAAVHTAIEEEVLFPSESLLSNGAVVSDLLSHSSGLPAEFASPRGGDPFEIEPQLAPGVRRIYSNVGFELLAQVLELRSGMDFERYLREAVLEPIGAECFRLDHSRYPQAGRSGAAAAMCADTSTLVGLVRLLVYQGPLAIDSIQAIRTCHYTDLVGVLPGYGLMDPCPWGQGAEIRGKKHPHWTGSLNSPDTFGHFGRSGSFLWIDPVNAVFAAGLCEVDFGQWAVSLWPRLSDAIVSRFLS